MEKLRLNESELQAIVEKKVFKRVCECVVKQDGDKWKVQGKDKENWKKSYASKEDAEKAVKEFLDKE